MKAIGRRGWFIAAISGLEFVLIAALYTTVAPPTQVQAGWFSRLTQHHAGSGHACCGHGQNVAPAGWAGDWYWMRSPDQEKRVVMSLYNRYCIRCHGVEGRGVWDIPDVPNFTDPRWQASRSDPQIVNIITEGRGACMPAFRGTLTLEEAWGMSHYLRTFVPGTEVARPDVGRASTPASTATPATPAPNPAPSASRSTSHPS